MLHRRNIPLAPGAVRFEIRSLKTIRNALIFFGVLCGSFFELINVGHAQSRFIESPTSSAPAEYLASRSNIASISENEQAYWRLSGKQTPAPRPLVSEPVITTSQNSEFETTSFESQPTYSTTSMSSLSDDSFPQQRSVQYSQPINSSQYGPCSDEWTNQWLPGGLIYRAYLASDRESRFRSYFFDETEKGGLWDITLGGRVALWRYGTTDAYLPQGWEVQLEGSALPRLNLESDRDVESVDFRAGVPIVYSDGAWSTKVAYYHISSHLGDEYMLRNPGFQRWNYSRDAMVVGRTYNFTPSLRAYAEAGWAFYTDVCQEWEFQFGFDYAPMYDTGIHGAPFVAANGHLHEEVNYSGNMVVQAGWAWRTGPNAHLFRVGAEYFNGLSDQYQFWNQFEEKIGVGLWYDY